MHRTLVMTALLSTLATAAMAQDAATDATTPMDRAAGNLNTPQDQTLSNAEVRRLQNNNVGGQLVAPSAPGVPIGETITPVARRLTPPSAPAPMTNTHDERMDITAPADGPNNSPY